MRNDPRQPRTARRATHPRAGLTLVESTMCLVIVSVVIAGMLSVVTQARITRSTVDERSTAVNLANSLLAEVAAMPYSDPDGSAIFGAEEGASRPAFDDVDDYLGYSESPCTQKNGSTIPNTTGYTRSVSVEWAKLNNLVATDASDVGLKRVTVVVQHNGVEVLRRVALRSAAWDGFLTKGGL